MCFLDGLCSRPTCLTKQNIDLLNCVCGCVFMSLKAGRGRVSDLSECAVVQVCRSDRVQEGEIRTTTTDLMDSPTKVHQSSTNEYIPICYHKAGRPRATG